MSSRPTVLSTQTSRRRVLAGALGLAALSALSPFAAGPARASLPGMPPGTRYGTPKAVGHGKAFAFATVLGGRTRSIGMFFSDGALEGHEGHQAEHADVILPMPAGIDDSAIVNATFGYMPMGHEPEVYSVPHIDAHFYFLTPAEVAAIDPASSDYEEKANRPVPPGTMPAGFVPPVPDGVPFVEATVPFMGLHWIDSAKSALVTGVFDHELIHGSWDGKWNFIEPMLTREWLLTKETHDVALTAPTTYPTAKAYPTRQRISYSEQAGGWVIELSRMVGGNAPTGSLGLGSLGAGSLGGSLGS